jgi:lysophospholipase L1-like esterase
MVSLPKLLVLTALGSLLAPSALGQAPLARPRHVIVLGDSLSDPKSHGGGYLTALSTACPKLIVDNHARGGFMLNQMRRRFEREVLPILPPDASDLILLGGVNDLYSDETAGRSLPKIEADLAAIFKQARARGLRVVALEVTPWGGVSRYFTPKRAEATRKLNAWLAAERAAGDIDVLVPSYGLLSCGDPEKLCPSYEPPFHDGLHFGKVGHERLGKALLSLAFANCDG